MQLMVNGELRSLTPPLSLAELLAELGLVGKRVAVEVNESIVPRSAHAGHILQPGDRIEVVHAIGGG